MAVAILALWLPACSRAPERDQQVDAQLQDRFSERKLSRHRLVPPIQAPPDHIEADAVAPRLPGTASGPVPEVYWVSELATPDAVTALARHDDLLGAGVRGFEAVLGWLEQAAQTVNSFAPGEPVPAGSMLQVLRCARQMLDAPGTFGVTAGGSARLATILSRVAVAARAADRRAWPLRCEALQLLGRVYTAAEAPVLAAGLADADAVTAASCAEALTIHEVRLPPVADSDPDSPATPPQQLDGTDFTFRTPGDWPPIPASLAARLIAQPGSRELRLRGVLDPTSELRARTLSRAPVWQSAIDRLAARSRAAVRGATVVWSLLDHPSLTVRTRAAHCLRLMTGEFAGYRPTAGAIQRQLQIARWAGLLIRIVPPAGSDPRTEGIGR